MSNVASHEQMAQVEEILHSLDRLNVAADDNRRAAPRITVRLSLTVILLVGTPPGGIMRIFTRNVSRSGVGFISRRPFKPQERIAIAFDVANQESKLVLARITFCRYIRAGMYEAGAEFLDSLPDVPGPDRIPPQWLQTPAHRKATSTPHAS